MDAAVTKFDGEHTLKNLDELYDALETKNGSPSDAEAYTYHTAEKRIKKLTNEVGGIAKPVTK